MLAPGEGRKVVMIALSMCALAHVRRKEMRKRWLGKLSDDSDAQGIVDHPAFGYLLENTMTFGLAYAIDRVMPIADNKRLFYSFLNLVVRGWLIVNTTLVFEKIAATMIWPHVPYFSAKKPAQDFKTLFRDYMRCNFPVEIVNSFMQCVVVAGLSDHQFDKLIVNPEPVKVLPFLGKFIISRIIVDVTFGVAHKIMHENQWVYDNVHKLHHEHQTPRTQTNLHFTWLDQFLEAVAPIYVALSTLTAMGLAPNRYEQTLLALPLIYFESCSHTGKEIPIVTWLPFMSPLADWLTGCDQRLIEYHTRHHQLYRCNYSISPWWDKLMGTYRIDLPEHYDQNASYE